MVNKKPKLIPRRLVRIAEDSRIPFKFRKAAVAPATNVGELIKQLQELPPDLGIFHGFGDKVRVAVTSVNNNYLALQLKEVDEDD